ncbi:MAG TPA: hypothetical protein VMY37_28040, partial [Thermoguttaceae bacterium]|nr:hypothetical protein [Thermoguttaceae bacterium]
MMKTRVVILVLLLAALQPLAAVLPAQTDAPPPNRNIASALQPFVDSHTLAGAVTLVATKDEVLSLEAVGYADVARRKPMRPDCL